MNNTMTNKDGPFRNPLDKGFQQVIVYKNCLRIIIQLLNAYNTHIW